MTLITIADEVLEVRFHEAKSNHRHYLNQEDIGFKCRVK